MVVVHEWRASVDVDYPYVAYSMPYRVFNVAKTHLYGGNIDAKKNNNAIQLRSNNSTTAKT